MSTKVNVHDTEDLFNEYKSIMQKMQHMNSIVQNDMIIEHSESIEFFEQLDNNVKSIQDWKQKVIDNFWSNLVRE